MLFISSAFLPRRGEWFRFYYWKIFLRLHLAAGGWRVFLFSVLLSLHQISYFRLYTARKTRKSIRSEIYDVFMRASCIAGIIHIHNVLYVKQEHFNMYATFFFIGENIAPIRRTRAAPLENSIIHGPRKIYSKYYVDSRIAHAACLCEPMR